jgi:hypothetical protein
MPSAPHGPRSSIAIFVALFGLVASLVHAAETAAPARVAVYFSPTLLWDSGVLCSNGL